MSDFGYGFQKKKFYNGNYCVMKPMKQNVSSKRRLSPSPRFATETNPFTGETAGRNWSRPLLKRPNLGSAQTSSFPAVRRASKPVPVRKMPGRSRFSLVLDIPASPSFEITSSKSQNGHAKGPAAIKELFSCVNEFVYVGDAESALISDEMKQRGITHVLNVGKSQSIPSTGFKYLRIPMRDISTEDITRAMYPCLSFIEECRAAGGKVLVHCEKGISRSPTVVLMYLMWRLRTGFDNCYHTLKQARPMISPTPSFIWQLHDIEKRLPLCQIPHWICTVEAQTCYKLDCTSTVSSARSVEGKSPKLTKSRIPAMKFIDNNSASIASACRYALGEQECNDTKRSQSPIKISTMNPPQTPKFQKQQNHHASWSAPKESSDSSTALSHSDRERLRRSLSPPNPRIRNTSNFQTNSPASIPIPTVSVPHRPLANIQLPSSMESGSSDGSIQSNEPVPLMLFGKKDVSLKSGGAPMTHKINMLQVSPDSASVSRRYNTKDKKTGFFNFPSSSSSSNMGTSPLGSFNMRPINNQPPITPKNASIPLIAPPSSIISPSPSAPSFIIGKTPSESNQKVTPEKIHERQYSSSSSSATVKKEDKKKHNCMIFGCGRTKTVYVWRPADASKNDLEILDIALKELADLEGFEKQEHVIIGQSNAAFESLVKNLLDSTVDMC
eukprot:TRINITY_DN3402_c0_g1_i1.p1 TRINITY_DN3402_c0_g1~~TRINITY_DN3402_c0_g1_i1.p1  ORF type:complete len:669 (-),score=161.18 TRINITY_DN3402_c0_g1_i1:157-2163(-)